MGWADDVINTLLGSEAEIPETAEYAVEAMAVLAETLADVAEGSTRTVAHALARKCVKMGVKVHTEDGQLPVEALSEPFCWYLGVDGLRSAVTRWVEKATAQRGVWRSQAAAIRALVLERADPRAARAAAQAAFSRA